MRPILATLVLLLGSACPETDQPARAPAPPEAEKLAEEIRLETARLDEETERVNRAVLMQICGKCPPRLKFQVSEMLRAGKPLAEIKAHIREAGR